MKNKDHQPLIDLSIEPKLLTSTELDAAVKAHQQRVEELLKEIALRRKDEKRSKPQESSS